MEMRKSQSVNLIGIACLILVTVPSGGSEAGTCNTRSPINRCGYCDIEAHCGGTDGTSFCWAQAEKTCGRKKVAKECGHGWIEKRMAYRGKKVQIEQACGSSGECLFEVYDLTSGRCVSLGRLHTNGPAWESSSCTFSPEHSRSDEFPAVICEHYGETQGLVNRYFPGTHQYNNSGIIELSPFAAPKPRSDTPVESAANSSDSIGDFLVRTPTALDKRTKLMWQRGRAKQVLAWKEAQGYCRKLMLAGHDDWRLPTPAEADSIRAPKSSGSGYINSRVFEVGSNAWTYWTNTRDPHDSRQAWMVDYTKRRSAPIRPGGGWEAKKYSLSVRCVRGPER